MSAIKGVVQTRHAPLSPERCLQKFAALHSSVHNLFNLERHLYRREKFKLN